MRPHKHAEIIKQWADGAEIQFLSTTGEWTDFDEDRSPSWVVDISYRVKPETIKYRVALLKWVNGPYYANTAGDDDLASEFEASDVFIRWITDWIEVEV